MLSDCRGGCYIPLIFPLSFLRLTHLTPSACSCLKTSLGALLLTSSSSPAHPLFIPQPAFTFDKETVQSLFSPTPGLLLLWRPVDMCLLNSETLAHGISFSPPSFLVFSFRLLNCKEVRRSQEGREGILPCGRDGKMVFVAVSEKSETKQNEDFKTTLELCFISEFIFSCIKHTTYPGFSRIKNPLFLLYFAN